MLNLQSVVLLVTLKIFNTKLLKLFINIFKFDPKSPRIYKTSNIVNPSRPHNADNAKNATRESNRREGPSPGEGCWPDTHSPGEGCRPDTHSPGEGCRPDTRTVQHNFFQISLCDIFSPKVLYNSY